MTFEQIKEATDLLLFLERRKEILDSLTDEKLLAFKVWDSAPNAPIFHGGCLRCSSQALHGVDRCKGCLYFRFDQSKPNLSIGRSADILATQ